MQVVMVYGSKGNREFVADLQGQAAALCKRQMVRVRWLPATDKAGLGCHILKMRLVAKSPFRPEDELFLIDAWSGSDLRWL